MHSGRLIAILVSLGALGGRGAAQEAIDGPLQMQPAPLGEVSFEGRSHSLRDDMPERIDLFVEDSLRRCIAGVNSREITRPQLWHTPLAVREFQATDGASASWHNVIEDADEWVFAMLADQADPTELHLLADQLVGSSIVRHSQRDMTIDDLEGLQNASITAAAVPPSYWPEFHFDFARTRGDDQRQVALGAFHRLFPLSNGYQGYEDLIGRENTVDINVGASLRPLSQLTLSANVHLLRHEGNDAPLYSAGSTAMRGGRSGPWPGIGAELDLSMQYHIDRRMSVLLGYGRFFADEFETPTGPGQDVDFIYANVLHIF